MKYSKPAIYHWEIAPQHTYAPLLFRPLGPLTYLRIWHDNSGKGPNASWYLSFVVFRDVQTGDKYEFIANRWLAVEKEDEQVSMFNRLKWVLTCSVSQKSCLITITAKSEESVPS